MALHTPGGARSAPPIVAMRGISKHYGGVAALDKVDFHVGRGEVVALLGDNGAGKSTLIKILAGAVRADQGTVAIDGREVEIGSPAQSKALGIETVYQDLALCDNVDVPTNIFLGRELRRPLLGGVLRLFDRRRMAQETRRLLGDLRINIADIHAPVRDFSGGQRQTIAIAKAVYSDANLIIMDEPTAALGVAQQEQVLSLIENLRARGEAIVLISHNMDDVMRVADRVVILKTGRLVTDRPVSDVDRQQLVRMIVSGVEEPPLRREVLQ
ncbi:ATP-binding cassette domain-containing protein [Rubellimicrobium arenae]|uniref:ATP-binding cassette domain-containing protein n=1 Tax=Rubellimicrobium arenae TaxID=2817372 RepID=UPI001B317242|nr:ATP-binding cassette domain-containing protein [Rubellimicrobium arenae]